MIGKLFEATIKTAMLPVAVASDVVRGAGEAAGLVEEQDRTQTERQLEAIQEALEDATDW